MDLQEMLQELLKRTGERRETSKHRRGHHKDDEARPIAYRQKRKARNKAASKMRAIQRRRDRQSAKRQRSGR